MARFRRLDAFAKPKHDVKKKTTIGGLITVIAATSAILLSLSEMYLYMKGMILHSLHLSESKTIPLLPTSPPLYPAMGGGGSKSHNAGNKKRMKTTYHEDKTGKIPLDIYVTFPHLACNQLDFTMNGASLRAGILEQTHGYQPILMKTPTSDELSIATHGHLHQDADINENSWLYHKGKGCTITGELHIPIVGGDFTITILRTDWLEATASILFPPEPGPIEASDQDASLSSRERREMMITEDYNKGLQAMNTSHYIHHIRFGDPLPPDFVPSSTSSTNPTTSSSILSWLFFGHSRRKQSHKNNPLEDYSYMVNNNYGGIALQQMQVRLIPTIFDDSYFPTETTSSTESSESSTTFNNNNDNKNIYQLSVVEHAVQPEIILNNEFHFIPGLYVMYDFSPLAVHYVQMRDNIIVFLGSLVSIIGGVFVTVGLLVSCFVHSAAAVTHKKFD